MNEKTIADRLYLNGVLVNVDGHICSSHEENSDMWGIEGHWRGWKIAGPHGFLQVYLRESGTVLVVVGKYDELNAIEGCSNRGSIRHNTKVDECRSWENFERVMQEWGLLFPEEYWNEGAKKLKERIEGELWREIEFEEWMKNGELDCPPEFFNRGILYPYDDDKYVEPTPVMGEGGRWPTDQKWIYPCLHTCEFCQAPFVSRISMEEHQYKDHGLARV